MPEPKICMVHVKPHFSRHGAEALLHPNSLVSKKPWVCPSLASGARVLIARRAKEGQQFIFPEKTSGKEECQGFAHAATPCVSLIPEWKGHAPEQPGHALSCLSGTESQLETCKNFIRKKSPAKPNLHTNLNSMVSRIFTTILTLLVFTGTAISAAAVGVGARRSAAKSIRVVSVS